MMKVQEWHKHQQINTTMAEQWKQQQNSEVMSMTDAHDPSPDEYSFPNQIQINKSDVEGSFTQKYSLVGEEAVNEAVTAGTPPSMKVDKSWGGPGSSQWMSNKRVRYSPYSPYVRQRTTARVGGPYQVVEPGSWVLQQDQYSSLASGNTMMPVVRENHNDDLAAITREFGIDTEEDNPFLNLSSGQGFLDQSQELYEELEQIQGGEQVANRQDHIGE